jgi:hypothetical protein
MHPENWILFKEFLMTFIASNVEILILFKNNENKRKKGILSGLLSK